MPFTSLNAEQPDERPKRGYWGFAAVCAIFFIWRVITTRKALEAALVTVILFAVGVPLIMGMRWAGAKFEAFGGWLVNRTKK